MSSIPRTLLLPLLLSGVTTAFAASQTTPDRDFVVNNDGTVTHNITGLTWKRCAEGQTWSNNACVGSASSYTYDPLKTITSNFAGKTDWRVPNIAELMSIVEHEKQNPSINSNMFPNTPNVVFWSNSMYAPISIVDVPSPATAWYVYFSDGGNGLSMLTGGQSPLNGSYAVRLVRGNSLRDASGAYSAATTFTNNGNGTVTDKKTNLTWQQCPAGQTFTAAVGATPAKCTGIVNLMTYDNAVKQTSNFAGQTDWRLPTLNELASIVEYNDAKALPTINSPGNPGAINSTIFPVGADLKFWSSSIDMALISRAWGISYELGDDFYTPKSDLMAVRFVRGGLPAVPGTEQPFDPGSNPTPTPTAENAEYNPATSTVTITDIQVGTQHYQAKLETKDGQIFSLAAGSGTLLSSQQHNQPATYAPATGILTLPRVKVSGKIYNATLKNTATATGGYVFSLQTASLVN